MNILGIDNTAPIYTYLDTSVSSSEGQYKEIYLRFEILSNNWI